MCTNHGQYLSSRHYEPSVVQSNIDIQWHLRFSLYRYLAISLFLQNNTDMPPSGACDVSVLYVSTLPRYPLYSYVEVYIISMRYYIALMPHLLLLPKLSLTYDINLYLHLSHCSLPNALSSLVLWGDNCYAIMIPVIQVLTIISLTLVFELWYEDTWQIISRFSLLLFNNML